jgi:hypothetical protein
MYGIIDIANPPVLNRVYYSSYSPYYLNRIQLQSGINEEDWIDCNWTTIPEEITPNSKRDEISFQIVIRISREIFYSLMTAHHYIFHSLSPPTRNNAQRNHHAIRNDIGRAKKRMRIQHQSKFGSTNPVFLLYPPPQFWKLFECEQILFVHVIITYSQ